MESDCDPLPIGLPHAVGAKWVGCIVCRVAAEGRDLCGPAAEGCSRDIEHRILPVRGPREDIGHAEVAREKEVLGCCPMIRPPISGIRWIDGLMEEYMNGWINGLKIKIL